MLLKCPECDLQVSDKAHTCPHCGYPMKSQSKTAVRKHSNKRRRLPNGFGQISEIKGQNLRKPFRAMVTVGKTSTGRPISVLLKPVAYFETYNEAYTALMEYNRNPYDLSPSITVQELYDRWTAVYFKTLNSDGSIKTTTNAWKYCSDVYDMRVIDLRIRHIKGCMTDGTIVVGGQVRHTTPAIRSKIKVIFNMMLDYAVEYEIVEKNVARSFNAAEKVKTSDDSHIPFTDEEMIKLWDNINEVPYVDIVLFHCYSGWRPQEIGLLEIDNVDLDKGVIVGGMKTDAGTNRTVPIHPKVQFIVEKRYNEALELKSKYLFNTTDIYRNKGGYQLNYQKYLNRFMKIVKTLNLDPAHRPHDPRKHFVTMAKKYNVDEYAIKYIIGHSISDITERVYTKRDTEWLITEMKKIK